MLEPYCSSDAANCVLSGEPISLPANVVLPLAMVFHELATNAVKHGAFRSPSGRLLVTWTSGRTADAVRRLAIRWDERSAVSTPPMRVGYGTTLVEATIMRSLGGRIRRSYRPEGLLLEITLRLA